MDYMQRLLHRQDVDEEERKEALASQSERLGQALRVLRHLRETYELASEPARLEFGRLVQEADVVLGA